MEKIEKNLEDGNKIILSIDDGYCTDVISISKGYLKDGILEKSITMSVWDDFEFSGWCEETKNIKELSFDFDINDPLYFCFNRVLKLTKSLTIDDDATYNEMQKYMKIKEENDIIKVTFINNDPEYKEYDKFGVFIKNIFTDYRSKIRDPNIKIGLMKFFRESQQVLTEEYHQITVDEYIKKLNYQKKK